MHKSRRRITVELVLKFMTYIFKKYITLIIFIYYLYVHGKVKHHAIKNNNEVDPSFDRVLMCVQIIPAYGRIFHI
jgi:hypothetical protein